MRHNRIPTGRSNPGSQLLVSAVLGRAFGVLMAFGALLLAACSAPDYSPVRDWAGAASRAADYPPVVASCLPREDGALRPPPLPGDAMLAMQAALSTYLSAVGMVAADGVLSYREDPFAQLAPRVSAASEAGGLAVRVLGGQLRRATRRNARAPQLGELISDSDDSVQALVAALKTAVRDAGRDAAEQRRALAVTYLQLERETQDAGARQALRELGLLRDREAAAGAAARTNYTLVLERIAEGHALLKASSSRLSQQEVARSIRVAEDALRRAADLLPRAMAPMPSGIACLSQLPLGGVASPGVESSAPSIPILRLFNLA